MGEKAQYKNSLIRPLSLIIVSDESIGYEAR